MSFSWAFQWYHFHLDPIWPDGTFNGNQTENDRYWQKIFFTFCKIFGSVQFFSHLQLKYAKSAIMTPKKFFLKNINMGIICLFQIRWCRLKLMPLKKAIAKNKAKTTRLVENFGRTKWSEGNWPITFKVEVKTNRCAPKICENESKRS